MRAEVQPPASMFSQGLGFMTTAMIDLHFSTGFLVTRCLVMVKIVRQLWQSQRMKRTLSLSTSASALHFGHGRFSTLHLPFLVDSECLATILTRVSFEAGLIDGQLHLIRPTLLVRTTQSRRSSFYGILLSKTSAKLAQVENQLLGATFPYLWEIVLGFTPPEPP